MAILFGTSFNITTGEIFAPAIQSKDISVAREEVFRLAKVIDRRNVSNMETLLIPNLVNLAAPTDISANGDVSGDITPATDVTTTINLTTRVGYILNIPDQLSLSAMYDLVKEWSAKAGYGLGLKVEDDLFGLWSGFTTNVVGDATSDMSPTRLLRCKQKLDEANVPDTERYGFFRPNQMTVMLDTDRFISTDFGAYSKADAPMLNGKFGHAYGIQLAWSNRVVSSTGIRNLVCHKDAIVLAMLRDVKVEKLARVHFADRIGASAFYGYAEKRDDHAVVCTTQ